MQKNGVNLGLRNGIFLFIDGSGEVTSLSKDEIVGVADNEAMILESVSVDTQSRTVERIAYAQDGDGNALDTNGNDYTQTWDKGGELAYQIEVYHSNLLREV